MPAKSTHFRVGNGDMMLIKFASGRCVLVDTNIRTAADDGEDDTPDVAQQLRERLTRDGEGRLFVDAFLLTHPDADHCRGLMRHFHLGPLSEWSKNDDKIVIREMWSSPTIFRRASKANSLGDDAKAWNAEARRRVEAFRAKGGSIDGERIKILGEDENGKTNDLGAILVRIDSTFDTIDGMSDSSFRARLLAPLPPSKDMLEEDVLTKNNSSVVITLTFRVGGVDAASYLIGGDAEVAIWERIWARNKHQPEVLAYDLAIAPHHCSWHSLSYDSWSEFREKARVSRDARNALGQAEPGAYVLSSSNSIKDDDVDPPCIRAKREYLSILDPVGGVFRGIADSSGDAPLEMEITAGGVTPARSVAAKAVPFLTGVGRQPVPHG
jgi:hypothetical protein